MRLVIRLAAFQQGVTVCVTVCAYRGCIGLGPEPQSPSDFPAGRIIGAIIIIIINSYLVLVVYLDQELATV